jgi:hypothetical protein
MTEDGKIEMICNILKVDDKKNCVDFTRKSGDCLDFFSTFNDFKDYLSEYINATD